MPTLFDRIESAQVALQVPFPSKLPDIDASCSNQNYLITAQGPLLEIYQENSPTFVYDIISERFLERQHTTEAAPTSISIGTGTGTGTSIRLPTHLQHTKENKTRYFSQPSNLIKKIISTSKETAFSETETQSSKAINHHPVVEVLNMSLDDQNMLSLIYKACKGDALVLKVFFKIYNISPYCHFTENKASVSRQAVPLKPNDLQKQTNTTQNKQVPTTKSDFHYYSASLLPRIDTTRPLIALKRDLNLKKMKKLLPWGKILGSSIYLFSSLSRKAAILFPGSQILILFANLADHARASPLPSESKDDGPPSAAALSRVAPESFDFTLKTFDFSENFAELLEIHLFDPNEELYKTLCKQQEDQFQSEASTQHQSHLFHFICMYLITRTRIFVVGISMASFNLIHVHELDTISESSKFNRPCTYLTPKNNLVLLENEVAYIYDQVYGKLNAVPLPANKKHLFISNKARYLGLLVNNLYPHKSIPEWQNQTLDTSSKHSVCIIDLQLGVPVLEIPILDVVSTNLISQNARLLEFKDHFAFYYHIKNVNHMFALLKEYSLDQKVYALIAMNEFQLAKNLVCESHTGFGLSFSKQDNGSSQRLFRIMTKMHADYTYSISNYQSATELYLQIIADTDVMEILDKFDFAPELLETLLFAKYDHPSTSAKSRLAIMPCLLQVLVRTKKMERLADLLLRTPFSQTSSLDQTPKMLIWDTKVLDFKEIDHALIDSLMEIPDGPNDASLLLHFSLNNMEISSMAVRSEHQQATLSYGDLVFDTFIPNTLNQPTFEECAKLIVSDFLKLKALPKIKLILISLHLCQDFLFRLLSSIACQNDLSMKFEQVWACLFYFLADFKDLKPIIFEFQDLLFEISDALCLKKDSKVSEQYDTSVYQENHPLFKAISLDITGEQNFVVLLQQYFAQLNQRLTMESILDLLAVLSYHDLPYLKTVFSSLKANSEHQTYYCLGLLILVQKGTRRGREQVSFVPNDALESHLLTLFFKLISDVKLFKAKTLLFFISTFEKYCTSFLSNQNLLSFVDAIKSLSYASFPSDTDAFDTETTRALASCVSLILQGLVLRADSSEHSCSWKVEFVAALLHAFSRNERLWVGCLLDQSVLSQLLLYTEGLCKENFIYMCMTTVNWKAYLLPESVSLALFNFTDRIYPELRPFLECILAQPAGLLQDEKKEGCVLYATSEPLSAKSTQLKSLEINLSEFCDEIMSMNFNLYFKSDNPHLQGNQPQQRIFETNMQHYETKELCSICKQCLISQSDLDSKRVFDVCDVLKLFDGDLVHNSCFNWEPDQSMRPNENEYDAEGRILAAKTKFLDEKFLKKLCK